MRRVLHQDIVALARCLLPLPKNVRRRYSERVVHRACQADLARQETGKAHVLFGDGTLQSACNLEPRADEGFLDDPDYVDCLVTALRVVCKARASGPAHK